MRLFCREEEENAAKIRGKRFLLSDKRRRSAELSANAGKKLPKKQIAKRRAQKRDSPDVRPSGKCVRRVQADLRGSSRAEEPQAQRRGIPGGYGARSPCGPQALHSHVQCAIEKNRNKDHVGFVSFTERRAPSGRSPGCRISSYPCSKGRPARWPMQRAGRNCRCFRWSARLWTG